MRVLHFFKTYFPDSFGGVERTIRAIAKGATAHGVHSDVLSLSHYPNKNTIEFDGHKAFKARLDFELASTGFSREVFSKFKELCDDSDVIHYHFPWPFMDLVHMIVQPEKPTVVTYHSDIVKQKMLLPIYRPLMHRFLSGVTSIVATSPNYLDSSEVLREYSDKISVIPIGLDEEDYPRASETLKLQWNARFPKPFFLFVGVLRYYKGLHVLVEAARHIEADIIIVGVGPMEAELRNQAQRANLNNIHFLGAIGDLDKAALLDLCRAFVFPSHLRSEAYGLSLVEAAMFGKPMITCEIGTGTSYVNKNGETGIVITPGDESALAEAMQKILSTDTSQYSQSSRARYLTLLRGATMAKKYADLYHSLRI